MSRWFDAMNVAHAWPDAWIIEEQVRRERAERQERERAWLELPLEEPDREDDAPPQGERPVGGTVIVIDL